MAPVSRTFLSKNGSCPFLKALQMQSFSFLSLLRQIMDSFIVKQLHPHLHIPAALCILKSCGSEPHCKIKG